MIRNLNIVPWAVGVMWLALSCVGCGDNTGISVCDIRHKSCQDSIFYEVQRLRGTEWDPWVDRPSMRVISAAQYRKELLDAQKKDQAGATPDEPKKVNHFEVTLELLGLLDPNRTKTAAVDSRVNNVAAFYSSGDKSVTIIDHGVAGDLDYGTSVLAHELVHAAQDRELNLETFAPPATVDADYARSTMIEGEATLYQNLVMIRAADRSIDELDWESYHSQLLDDARQRVFDDDSPYYQLQGLLYALGSRLLTDHFLAGGNASVRDVWNALPTQTHFFVDRDDVASSASSTHLMRGDPGYTFKPQAPLPCSSPKAPADYEIWADTSMGAVFLFGMATRIYEGPDVAWDLARGYLADRLTIYINENQDTIATWQIRVDKAQMKSFAAATATYFGADAVTSISNQVNIMQFSAEAAPNWGAWKSCRGPN